MQADRAFPSAELLGWFEARSRWIYVMQLQVDTWIHGTATPMGCECAGSACPAAIAVGSEMCSSGVVAAGPTWFWSDPLASQPLSLGTWPAN